MRNLKIILSYFILMFGLLNVANVYAQDPVSLLQNIANEMIAGLKQNKATLHSKPQVVYSLAYRYVVPHADLDEMSRRVLPAQIWNAATASQRQEFKKQFTLTLIRTYASALSSYQDQSVKFFPMRGSAGNIVEVSGEITSPEAQPIRVSYQLIRAGNAFRLMDMSVEGVSMLDSFRSQFAEILSTGNMNELLRQLQVHNSGVGR